jgi:hypothetical protein
MEGDLWFVVEFVLVRFIVVILKYLLPSLLFLLLFLSAIFGGGFRICLDGAELWE